MAEKCLKKISLFRRKHWKIIKFTVQIEKDVKRIDKNGEEVTKNLSYILQFIDSARFMASSLSNLVTNLFEGIHRIKCKYVHDDKKCEICGIKHKYCNCFLEYGNFKDDFIECKYLRCNKNINTTLMKS